MFKKVFLILVLSSSILSFNILVFSSHADITTGLIGYYTFDENQGTTINDYSGNNKNGTINGGTPVWTTGKYGYGLYFDGINDWIDLGNDSNTFNFEWNEPFSICMWLKRDGTTGANQFIISRRDSGQGVGWMLMIMNATNKIRMNFASGGSIILDSSETFTSTPPTEWFHLVMTYSGSGIDSGVNIYANGVPLNLNKSGQTISSGTLKTNVEVRISSRNDNSVFFKGIMDEIRIYNRELIQSDINEIYNNVFKAYIPLNLKVLSGIQQASLTWDTPRYSELVTVSSYKIYKKKSTDASYTLLTTLDGNTRTYKDTSFSASGTYSYYVTSIVNSVESETSNIVSADVLFVFTDKVDSKNTYTKTLQSSKGEIKLEIPANTLNKDVNLTIDPSPTLLAGNQSTTELKGINTGVEIKVSESSVKYQKGIRITIPYSDNDVMGVNENKLVIAYYDEKEGKWMALPSSVDNYNNKVTATTSHLSLFQIMEYFVQQTAGVKVYPNPFTPKISDSRFNKVNFSFENSSYNNVELRIWDITGRTIRVLTETGVSIMSWDGKDDNADIVEAGVYIYQLKVGNILVGKGTIVLAK
jgi:hypothetical protein